MVLIVRFFQNIFKVADNLILSYSLVTIIFLELEMTAFFYFSYREKGRRGRHCLLQTSPTRSTGLMELPKVLPLATAAWKARLLLMSDRSLPALGTTVPHNWRVSLNTV